MTAAGSLALPVDTYRTETPRAVSEIRELAPRTPALVLPVELEALFDESPKVKGSFYNLADRDRLGFVQYVEQAKTPTTRERRAALIAMSLIGLAADAREDKWVRDESRR